MSRRIMAWYDFAKSKPKVRRLKKKYKNSGELSRSGGDPLLVVDSKLAQERRQMLIDNPTHLR